jgi:hypothetical protein
MKECKLKKPKMEKAKGIMNMGKGYSPITVLKGGKMRMGGHKSKKNARP